MINNTMYITQQPYNIRFIWWIYQLFESILNAQSVKKDIKQCRKMKPETLEWGVRSEDEQK